MQLIVIASYAMDMPIQVTRIFSLAMESQCNSYAGGEGFFHFHVWASCLFGLFGGALGRIRRVDREILVIVCYASQKVFLEEH